MGGSASSGALPCLALPCTGRHPVSTSLPCSSWARTQSSRPAGPAAQLRRTRIPQPSRCWRRTVGTPLPRPCCRYRRGTGHTSSGSRERLQSCQLGTARGRGWAWGTARAWYSGARVRTVGASAGAEPCTEEKLARGRGTYSVASRADCAREVRCVTRCPRGAGRAASSAGGGYKARGAEGRRLRGLATGPARGAGHACA